MKERKDFVLIKHKPGKEHDFVRIVDGPITREYRRADEPHEVLKAEFDGPLFSVARPHFEIAPEKVVVPDKPAEAGKPAKKKGE